MNDIIEKSPVNEKNLKKKENGVQEINFDVDEVVDSEQGEGVVDVPVVYSDHNPYKGIKEREVDEGEPVFSSEEVDD